MANRNDCTPYSLKEQSTLGVFQIDGRSFSPRYGPCGPSIDSLRRRVTEYFFRMIEFLRLFLLLP